MQHSSKYSSILLMDAKTRPFNIVVYFNELGEKVKIQDEILRVVEKDEQEYLELKKETHIAIEKIYSVDGEVSPHHSNDYFKCDCV